MVITMEEQRKSTLTSDPLVVDGSVQPSHVQCKGCHQLVRLDGSGSRYFVQMWYDHKRVCEGVKALLERWTKEHRE